MSKRITLPAQALYVPPREFDLFRARFRCEPAEFSTITINVADEAVKAIRDAITGTMSITDTVVCTRPDAEERFNIFNSSDLLRNGLQHVDIKPHKGVSVGAVGIAMSVYGGKVTPIMFIHTDGRTWKDWWLRYPMPMLPIFQASNSSIRYIINQ